MFAKVVKSVEERYPLAPVVAWVMARVVPLKVSGALTTAEAIGPRPLPMRMPPSEVVLPVPPTFTVRVLEAERVLVELKYAI